MNLNRLSSLFVFPESVFRCSSHILSTHFVFLIIFFPIFTFFVLSIFVRYLFNSLTIWHHFFVVPSFYFQVLLVAYYTYCFVLFVVSISVFSLSLCIEFCIPLMFFLYSIRFYAKIIIFRIIKSFSILSKPILFLFWANASAELICTPIASIARKYPFPFCTTTFSSRNSTFGLYFRISVNILIYSQNMNAVVPQIRSLFFQF